MENNLIDKAKEKFKGKQSKEITEVEAYEIIDGWGEDLEVRLNQEDFEAVQKEVWKAVSKERLLYDNNREIFTYVLKKPIEFLDGSGRISIIEIHESDMQSKKKMSKFKDDIDKAAALLQAHCKMQDGSEIEHGFLTRIKDRDSAIIMAVILGFFVQAVPESRQ